MNWSLLYQNSVLLGVLLFLSPCSSARTTTRKRASSSHNHHKAPSPPLTCAQDQSLLLYRVIVLGGWSRDQFPKHFPDWRPKAHFSKVVGRSHHPSYKLWRLNERVSQGVKLFAETGSTDVLLNGEPQNNGLIFDDFNAPSFLGLGKTEAEFFVDGNHSRVSIISRLVPSPDWFIGIDSLDLCNDGNWISSLSIDAHPFDAGTDNGLTFTSPNWPTIPPSPVSQLTSRNPDHPANSFYYEDREHHPPIATIQFIKVKEYELSQVYNHHPQMSYETESLPTQRNNNFVYDPLPSRTDLISFRPLNLKHETLSSWHQKSGRKNKNNNNKTNKKLRKTRNCDDCGTLHSHKYFNWGFQQGE